MEDTWAIGIDIGTASIRSCVTRGDGTVVGFHEDHLPRTHHPDHQEFITQSSTQMWDIIRNSIKKVLQSGLDEVDVSKIKGIGVDATCSLVVLKKNGAKLEPYPVDFGFQQLDQNVVLWMDHRSTKELLELNAKCLDEPFMSRIGGAFLPEMGVPKLKYLVDRIPSKDLPDLLFMELYEFVSIMLLTDGYQHLYHKGEYKGSHAHSEIALDGSTKGWSKRLLTKFGLEQLAMDNYQMVGRAEATEADEYLPLPFAGSRIGEICSTVKEELGLSSSQPIYIGHGVIDCYAGWVATVKELDSTLSMVAGTSTCFLIASPHDSKQIPGVWGPFNNFIKDFYISELGLSATGALIEHLFKSHPAFPGLRQQAELELVSVYDKLETLLQNLSRGLPSANHLIKHMSLYGDILGNRTPYSDPMMRGAFIGESADLSVKDLALKYLSVLEFLALQTRQIVNTFTEGGYNIGKISMSGSQFGNKRLVELIEVATGKEVVSYQWQAPLFTVVKGASMLGFAAASGGDIRDVMATVNTPKPRDVSVVADRDSLRRLLEVKYQVMLDMASSQLKYREWIESI